MSGCGSSRSGRKRRPRSGRADRRPTREGAKGEGMKVAADGESAGGEEQRRGEGCEERRSSFAASGAARSRVRSVPGSGADGPWARRAGAQRSGGATNVRSGDQQLGRSLAPPIRPGGSPCGGASVPASPALEARCGTAAYRPPPRTRKVAADDESAEVSEPHAPACGRSRGAGAMGVGHAARERSAPG